MPGIELILAAAFMTAGSSAERVENPVRVCLIEEVDRIANDPEQAAELRRWTRWEATRWLWSLAGDSARCAPLTSNGVSNATMNAVYRHADRLIVRRHLHRV